MNMVAKSRMPALSWKLIVGFVVAIGLTGALLSVPTLTAKAWAPNAAYSYSMSPAPDLGDLLRRLGSR
jgi:hypothetical protein